MARIRHRTKSLFFFFFRQFESGLHPVELQFAAVPSRLPATPRRVCAHMYACFRECIIDSYTSALFPCSWGTLGSPTRPDLEPPSPPWAASSPSSHPPPKWQLHVSTPPSAEFEAGRPRQRSHGELDG